MVPDGERSVGVSERPHPDPVPMTVGLSARLIVRTALNSDKPGLVEVLLHAFPDLFQRAFGGRLDAGGDALLRLLSEPVPAETLWIAAFDEDVIASMQVGTLRTPAPDVLKLLQIMGGYLGFLPGLKATMTINPFLSKPSEQGLYINYIAVRPEFQRHGVGRTMLQRAIELTMYEGLPQTMTWLPDSSRPAQKLHDELGFRVRKTYRSTLLQRLTGEGVWHYYTRPAAIPVRNLKPVVELS
ncbi:MAG: GNAT family N-acetyltransferase, partial [bacterium]